MSSKTVIEYTSTHLLGGIAYLDQLFFDLKNWRIFSLYEKFLHQA
jgi:hypothetical protein